MTADHDHIAGRGMVALGGCSIVLIVTLAAGAGACFLYKHRGEAGSAIAAESMEDLSELDAVRLELLILSGEISDPARARHDLTRASRQLETIEIRLATQRKEHGYLKVRALYESVDLQLEILKNKDTGEDEIPPLPPASTVPEMNDRYVGTKVKKSALIKSRIFTPSPTRTIRYGPALFHVARKPKKRSAIGSLDAPKGWKFIEVELGVTGTAALVEYSLLLMDDFRRAFPPYLGAEKYLARGKLSGSSGQHAVWREVHETTSKKKVLWLHRVFALPKDSIDNPVLEIQRQGAAKRVWIQY
ncbi:MAG: hypothetical protein JRG91_10830 [Deltaproteobacteria bacterium]|nr:hypothetical protein [Deltaproteobacteria bacterium]